MFQQQAFAACINFVTQEGEDESMAESKPSSNRKRPWRDQSVGYDAYKPLGVVDNDGKLVLQPWFVPEEICRAIQKLIPQLHIKKMRYYFDDHGCIRCRRKKVLYGGNGFCDRCLQRLMYRVIQSLRKRIANLEKDIPADGNIFADGMMKAQRLVQRRGSSTSQDGCADGLPAARTSKRTRSTGES
jgi:hypothetical protein